MRAMSPWLRRLGAALITLLLIAHAHAPVIPVGPTGGEYHTLVDVEELVHAPEDLGLEQRFHLLFDVHGTEGRPLPALSLAVSTLLWSPDAGRLFPLRVENLVLLVLAAWCTSVFVRRLLVPWLGSEQAAAAGLASALLIVVQPLNIASVATVGARGDLMALGFSAAAAALFLRSRQDRRYLLSGVAALLALLAGLSSRLALGLPLVVALAEFASSRRYRPAHVRLRTALTTLLVFAGCVAFDLLVWNVQSGFSVAPPDGAPPLASRLAVSVERLGALLLPVNAARVGVLGFGLAGVLLLVVLQPALAAARSAPRLWGWMLLGWASITVVAELLAPPVRVRPEDFSHAATLLSAATAACVGLGVAATALSGLRRVVLPIALAVGWSVLAHQNGIGWSESARSAAQLRVDLLTAREVWGYEHEILLVDPPGRVAGVDSVEGALPWMLDPLFGGARAGSERPSVRAISSGGLRALAREPEFARLRAEPLIVVFALDALGARNTSPADGERRSTRLDPYTPTPGQRSWFRQGDSGRIDLEMLGIAALEVTGADETDTSVVPAVSWRSDHLHLPELREVTLEGVWTSVDDPATVVFDLSSSLAWILGGRVQRIWSARGWIGMREAVLLDALPTPDGDAVPRVEGSDWFFDAPHGAHGTRGEWWVELLDLETWGWVELRAEITAGGSLHIRGAAAHEEAVLRAGPGPVAWTLEQRRDGVAIQRVRGLRRRVAD